MSRDPVRGALVTGAAGGMGVAVCEALLSRGWQVAGLDHNADRLGALARKLEGRGFTPVLAELSDPKFPEVVEARLGAAAGLRGLVNLAGVSLGDSLERMALSDWEKSMAVNATAPMLLSRWAVPRMRESGGGSIVNVASPVALVGARKPSYSASKAALLGLTMSMARELGSQRIRVNALLPGPVITRMTSDWDGGKRRAVAEGNFLKRLCEPAEVASAVAFLLSDDSSFMTGATLDLTSGGMFGH